MKRRTSSNRETLQQRMVREGIASYPHVLIALNQFISLIHEACHQIVGKQSVTLRKQIRFRGTIVDDPKQNRPRLYETSGAWVTCSGLLGNGVWLIWGMIWRREDGFKPSAIACFEVAKRLSKNKKQIQVGRIERLLEKRKPRSAVVYKEGRYIGLKRELVRLERREFSEHLGTLLRSCVLAYRFLKHSRE